MANADYLPMLDRIRRNAELVVSVANKQLGEVVSYDEAGVRWLDGYIQRQHKNGDPANRDALVSTLGSFLGECIIHTFGGRWAENDECWFVQFEGGNAAYPFVKVSKHLEHGEEDSVLSFFNMIPVVFQFQ
jgi:hypothetical protein